MLEEFSDIIFSIQDYDKKKVTLAPELLLEITNENDRIIHTTKRYSFKNSKKGRFYLLYKFANVKRNKKLFKSFDMIYSEHSKEYFDTIHVSLSGNFTITVVSQFTTDTGNEQYLNVFELRCYYNNKIKGVEIDDDFIDYILNKWKEFVKKNRSNLLNESVLKKEIIKKWNS